MISCRISQSLVSMGEVVRGNPAARGAFFGCLLLMGLSGFLLPLAGCTYYAVPAGTVVTTPASFDRSFAAASGAIRDEGLSITVQDPGSGTIVGGRGDATVTASVRQQADGSVVVQFDSKGSDPSLLDSVSRSYDRRMGR